MSAPQFYSVAIGGYDSADLPSLDADGEAAAVQALLAPFGVSADTPWDGPATSLPIPVWGLQDVQRRLTGWATGEADASILYWVGHGLVDESRALLATGSCDPRFGDGSVDPLAFAAKIERRRSDRQRTDQWVLIIIDACKSASFVDQLESALAARSVTHYLLLASSEPASRTNLGVFRTALTNALPSFRSIETVPVGRLAREVQRQLDPAGVVRSNQIDDAVLRNAWAVPAGMLTPADRVPQVEEVMKTLTDVERHTLLDAASGGAFGTTTWLYSGRAGELREVATWLQGDQNLLIVTGAPGSGKSAFLGDLLLRSNRSVWQVAGQALREEFSEGAELPTVLPFAGMLRLTGLTLDDVLVRLTERLGLPFPSGVGEADQRLDWLCDRLVRDAESPRTVLIDSLDEAVLPVEIAQAVLARLAATGAIRFVVGTRWSTRSQLDVGDDADRDLLVALQAPGLHTSTLTLERDPAALREFVSKRLRSWYDGSPTAFLGPDLEPLADCLVDASPDFLFARLALVEANALPGLIDVDRLKQLVTGTHTDLFGRAFVRLGTEHPSFTSLLRALAVRRGRGLPVEQGLWAETATAFGGAAPATAHIQALVGRAGAYLLMDTEAEVTVYRLAHESYEALIRDGRV